MNEITTPEALAAIVMVVVAISALLLSAGVTFGYARLLRRESGVVLLFSWSQVLIFGAYAMRCVYWALDTAYLVYTEGTIAPPPGRFLFNMPLDVLVVIAAFCALKATYKMIPEHERAAWNWYSSPFYPDDTLPKFIRYILIRSNHMTDRRARPRD